MNTPAGKKTGRGSSQKKGEGVSKNKPGGGVIQFELLDGFEKTLGIGAVEAATILGTSYNTYKCWKNNSRKMSGTAVRFIDLLLEVRGTKAGKRFGV